MLLDLTRPALLILFDECPRSLVVRAMRKEGGDGGIWQYSIRRATQSFKNEVTPIKADRSVTRNGYILTETRIPIEACLPFGYVKADVTLERFEVQTLRSATTKDGRHAYGMWRGAVEVKWEKQQWFISVQDVARSVELAAFRTRLIDAGARDDFPLDRIQDYTSPRPPEGNQTAWGRLLNDD